MPRPMPRPSGRALLLPGGDGGGIGGLGGRGGGGGGGEGGMLCVVKTLAMVKFTVNGKGDNDPWNTTKLERAGVWEEAHVPRAM